MSNRLIMALDVPNIDQAKQLVNTLEDSVSFYKVGLELFMTGRAFELIDWLKSKDKQIFVDLKFFDIPATVARAVKQLDQLEVDFATIHGNDQMMQQAAQAADKVDILAVTVLTSLDQGDINDLGFQCNVEELVVSRAKRAVQHGCAGVVASGHEAAQIRQAIGDDKCLIVAPGIRPVINDDEQKRVMNVEQAFDNGVDYIVVGRPIRDAQDPKQMALLIQQQIEQHIKPRI